MIISIFFSLFMLLTPPNFNNNYTLMLENNYSSEYYSDNITSQPFTDYFNEPYYMLTIPWKNFITVTLINIVFFFLRYVLCLIVLVYILVKERKK